MSLRERIQERRQVDLTPLHERRGEDRRSTPRWIQRRIERELRGEDGMTAYDTTWDTLKEVA